MTNTFGRYSTQLFNCYNILCACLHIPVKLSWNIFRHPRIPTTQHRPSSEVPLLFTGLMNEITDIKETFLFCCLNDCGTVEKGFCLNSSLAAALTENIIWNISLPWLEKSFFFYSELCELYCFSSCIGSVTFPSVTVTCYIHQS